jgi:carbamoyltransferase
MGGSFLGPAFSQAEIEARLRSLGAEFSVEPNENEYLSHVAEALIDGKAVGWFHGRMEFGPRALGARSILGDARSPSMQRTLNLKIKKRESFRPFAPSILREDVADWLHT